MNNFVLAFGEIENIRYYNCGMNVGTKGPSHVVLGIALISVGLPTVILYSLCICCMFQGKLRKTTCYRLMIYLGFVDVGALLVNSIESGILAINGAVYCTYPTLMYVTGAAGLALWCCSCLSCFMLVVNRLIHLWNMSASQTLTPSPWWPALICLSAATVYTFYFFFFTPPLLFNSERQAWFFDPFVTGNEPHDYNNHPHSVNNLLIVMVTVIAYVCFILLLRGKYRKHDQKFSFKNNPIVVQAIMMCFFNLVAALVYVYMQYFPIWPPLILIGHFSWIFGHGCPPYLYLTLNVSMRKKILALVRLRKNPSVRPVVPQGECGSGTQIQRNIATVKTLNLPKLVIVERPDKD